MKKYYYLEDIFKSVQKEGKEEHNGCDCYEKGFMNKLLNCFELDPYLKKFYIRFIFECDNVLRIIEKIEKNVIGEESFVFLKQTLDNMKTAESYSELAMEDYIFHRWMFCAADRGFFFSWYDRGSRGVKYFLSKFWENIQSKNIIYKKLINIHEEIADGVINTKREQAIGAIEYHFAIVLFQSFGLTHD